MVDLPQLPSFRLDGKRALITGASRGIGFGGACALAASGAEITMVARDSVSLNSSVSALRDSGYTADGLALDITDHSSVISALSDCGAFDILFSNAGTNTPEPFLDADTATYDEIMDLNVRSAFFLSQEVAKGMVSSGIRGSIIHTSSQMGHVGGIDRSVYCGSKFAIEGITKASALELAPYGIRVNTISPTFIRTPMTKSTFDNPARVRWIEDKIKLGRVGEVEDIMGSVIFLASDASSLITGTSILIDGGWTAD